ncbi:MAG: Hsp20/alpha crystallin family protein [Bacteroidetes bacterium]|nr:Hsp20/alpha crystallin family protein [Bacteroidota bacterium]
MNTIVKCGYRPMFPTFFNEVFESAAAELKDSYYKPAANIKESETGYGIELALPGFEKEEINMKVEKNILEITAGHERKENENEETYSRIEFNRSGKYSRSFILPDTVNLDAIQAEYKNGVLKVNLPKKEVQPVTKKDITIA